MTSPPFGGRQWRCCHVFELSFVVCFSGQYDILLLDEFYGQRRTEWENN
ncbi:hypothetical protein TGS27_2998 [Geobacillus stearothermophilus]|nr:hypothetical protein TGS27_2998 [Geobacillus stearothermophilus]